MHDGFASLLLERSPLHIFAPESGRAAFRRLLCRAGRPDVYLIQRKAWYPSALPGHPLVIELFFAKNRLLHLPHAHLACRMLKGELPEVQVMLENSIGLLIKYVNSISKRNLTLLFRQEFLYRFRDLQTKVMLGLLLYGI